MRNMSFIWLLGFSQKIELSLIFLIYFKKERCPIRKIFTDPLWFINWFIFILHEFHITIFFTLRYVQNKKNKVMKMVMLNVHSKKMQEKSWINLAGKNSRKYAVYHFNRKSSLPDWQKLIPKLITTNFFLAC